MFDSFQPRGLQHAGPPCPLPSPRVCSNSCLLSQWYYLTISFSSTSFFCLLSFPVSGSFLKLALHTRWPKYWGSSFSISPSNEYSGLIFVRIDCFDLFAFQGTLRSLLEHHYLKLSVLQCAAFLMAQLSHPLMITGKHIALTISLFMQRDVSGF